MGQRTLLNKPQGGLFCGSVLLHNIHPSLDSTPPAHIQLQPGMACDPNGLTRERLRAPNMPLVHCCGSGSSGASSSPLRLANGPP